MPYLEDGDGGRAFAVRHGLPKVGDQTLHANRRDD